MTGTSTSSHMNLHTMPVSTLVLAFFLNHGRHPVLPVALAHPMPSPAVNDFVMQLQNRIAAAHDHIRATQAVNTDRCSVANVFNLSPFRLETRSSSTLSTII
eukprot:3935818-Rhodomonas_salina.4